MSCFVFFQNTFFTWPLCNRLPDTSMKLVIFIMILFLHKIILHLPCMLCIKTEWARKFPVLKPYHFQKHDPFSSIDPPSPHVNSLYCDFVSQSHWTESGDAGDTRFKYGRKSKCGQFAAKHHRAQIHLWKIWLVFASLSKSEIFQGNRSRLTLRLFGAETPPSVWSRSHVSLKKDIIRRDGTSLKNVQQERYLRRAKDSPGGV